MDKKIIKPLVGKFLIKKTFGIKSLPYSIFPDVLYPYGYSKFNGDSIGMGVFSEEKYFTKFKRYLVFHMFDNKYVIDNKGIARTIKNHNWTKIIPLNVTTN